MPQNWQKTYPHSIWGTTCDAIVIFSTFIIFSTFEAFFQFSKILILGEKWSKRAKIGQEKPVMLSASFLRNYTSNDCDFWDAGVKWWYIQVFFSFLKKFFGLKWPKMTCNGIYIIFCKLNIIWLWFLVRWCEMMIFWAKKGGKGKEGPVLMCASFLRNYKSYQYDFWYTHVEWWNL